VNILLIDNFDSFTYNLYQYLAEIADAVTVVRNDHVPFDALKAGRFTHIVISPGPGNPTDPAYFGDCRDVVERFHGKYPLLGVCLGHQGIGAYFGAAVVQAPKIMHGKTSTFTHSRKGLFAGLPNEITVMRYHSLALDPASMPEELIVDAQTEDDTIMAFRHGTAPTYGLQFHPESFGTPEGKQLLRNFLKV
jgi:anthranilate synthase/aminodeoxychorismate synthase-like glutamine amidotransferase